MGPEGTSGQCHLPLSMSSYIPSFKAMFHLIAVPIDFILWHATLVAIDTFLHLSLVLYEFGPPVWTLRRDTWRKLKKAASLSGAVDAVVTVTPPTLRVHAVPLMTPFLVCVGARGISSRRGRMRVLLCVFVPRQVTACLIVVKR